MSRAGQPQHRSPPALWGCVALGLGCAGMLLLLSALAAALLVAFVHALHPALLAPLRHALAP